MKLNKIHSWNLSTTRAKALQLELEKLVKLAPLKTKQIEHVAGSDIALSKKLDRLVSVVVVFSFPSLEVIETRTASAPASFPYVPGLLSFREIPVLLKALSRLRTPFEVMLCDGQGIAHPRGLGLASHVGLFIDKPTVGCAKSRLIGEHKPVGPKRGDYKKLIYKGKSVGIVLRTRQDVKPMYISPGNMVDAASSRRIALACSKGYRVPEPTRIAHILAGKRKRELEGSP